MADFCKQCSVDNFGEDFEDFADLSSNVSITPPPPNATYQVLCEGCGETVVDNTGKCIWPNCLKEHGKTP